MRAVYLLFQVAYQQLSNQVDPILPKIDHVHKCIQTVESKCHIKRFHIYHSVQICNIKIISTSSSHLLHNLSDCESG